MSDQLKKLLEKQLAEYKKLLVKIDAGVIAPESLGYNPKIIVDEKNLIEQLLYLQEVKAEIASHINNQAAQKAENA